MADPSRVASEVTRTLVEILWRQWRSFGAAVTGPVARHIVDPEALLLASMELVAEERRLADLVTDWIRTSSTNLSVQRTRNLSRRFSGAAQRLPAVADLAVGAKDFRWRAMMRTGRSVRATPTRGKQLFPSIRLLEPATLVLRLRRALGVGVRADTLSFLIGSQGLPRNVRTIAEATAYTVVATRRAAEDLAAAGFGIRRGSQPVEYTVDVQAWRRFLGMKSEPRWRNWSGVLPTLLAVREWGIAGKDKKSPYLLSSHARDLIQMHQHVFEGVSLPGHLTGESPEDVLRSFDKVVSDLCSWARSAV